MYTRSHNAADLGIAVASTLIQIPAIHDSTAYPWLTIFQICRFYRVVIALPRMKRLLVRFQSARSARERR